jgi:hypothetical protein
LKAQRFLNEEKWFFCGTNWLYHRKNVLLRKWVVGISTFFDSYMMENPVSISHANQLWLSSMGWLMAASLLRRPYSILQKKLTDLSALSGDKSVRFSCKILYLNLDGNTNDYRGYSPRGFASQLFRCPPLPLVVLVVFIGWKWSFPIQSGFCESVCYFFFNFFLYQGIATYLG